MANNAHAPGDNALLTPTAAVEGLRAKSKRFAKEGAKVLGVAALKVVTRTLAWGAFGLLFGAVIWNILYWTGLLEIAWEPWSYLVWVLLLLYILLGAAGLGYVGSWRGFGRTILYVGVERGLVVYLVEKVLDKLASLLASARGSSSTIDSAIGTSQSFIENLPLQQWEERLKAAVQAVLNEDDEAISSKGITGGVARRIRAFIVVRIEKYLLTIVRKEIDENKGGGVSIEKVRGLALEQVELFFEDFIEGLMNKKLMLGLIILTVLYVVAPIVALFV